MQTDYRVNYSSIILMCSLYCSLAKETAFAQAEILPKGIGIFEYWHRQYDNVDSYYNEDGQKKSIGSQFDSNLSGGSLVNGKFGEDLQTLAMELNQYSPDGTEPLGDSLSLGEIKGDVDAKITVRAFGFGYGLTNRWTVFFGVPVVKADVKADVHVTGVNNALNIRDRLGDLAFTEINDGLLLASKVSSSEIKEQILANGYHSIDRWQRTDYGDLRVGARTGYSYKVWEGVIGANYTLMSTLPTGYKDDPNHLTDIPFGKDYASLLLSFSPSYTYRSRFAISGDFSYQYNFDAKSERRVPEKEETLVAAERSVAVNYNPGDDVSGSLKVKYDFGIIDIESVVGMEKHYQDRYSGSLDGNYSYLAKGSDSQNFYQNYGVGIDTIDLYKQGRFFYPMRIKLSRHKTISATNFIDQHFYQLSLSNFLSNPYHRD